MLSHSLSLTSKWHSSLPFICAARKKECTRVTGETVTSNKQIALGCNPMHIYLLCAVGSYPMDRITEIINLKDMLNNLSLQLVNHLDAIFFVGFTMNLHLFTACYNLKHWLRATNTKTETEYKGKEK